MWWTFGTPSLLILDPMWTFVITVAATVLIYLLFAGFERWGVQSNWAITINYYVAAILGWNLAGGASAMVAAVEAPWLGPLAILGLAFYPLFRLTARCSQELGVSVATISTKLSMAIPVLVFALFDGWHLVHWGQWCGLALAFPAVWLSSQGPAAAPQRSGSPGLSAAWMPVVMFLGSGTIDLMFGWHSSHPSLDLPGMRMAFASVPFTLGALVGTVDQIRGQKGWPSLRDFAGGTLLGVVNFGSLYFLLLAFDAGFFERTLVVPLLNLSVIVVATLAGALLLSDIPHAKTRWGVALATASIGLMMWFGQ